MRQDEGGIGAAHAVLAADAAPIPLSSGQLRWWVAHQLASGVPATIALYLDLCGPLDIARLRTAIRSAAVRLQSPHVRIRLVDGTPHQYLDPAIFGDLTEIDLTGVSVVLPEGADHDAAVLEALSRMERDRRARLDLCADAITVATLYRVGPERCFLYLRSHHLVLDGVGAAALLRLAAENYSRGEGPGRGTVLSIEGLVDADRAYRDSSRAVADREFWVKETAGLPDPVGIAGIAAPASACPHRVSACLDERAANLLAAARQRYAASFPELTAAAFAAFLARMSGSDEVVLSLPVAARPTAALRRSAGSVSNVVPLWLRDLGTATVQELIDQVRLRVIGALRHQCYRYEDIQRARGETHLARGGFGPVINLLGFTAPLTLGAATGRAHLLSLGPVEDLLVNGYQLGPDDTTATIDFQANPARYDAATLTWYHRLFLDWFATFLAVEPTGRINDLAAEMRSGAESESSTRTAACSATASTLGALFSEFDKAGTVAVVDGGRSMTYRELGESAARWAKVLIAYGATPGSPVLSAIPRSLESVLAVRAIAAAGACLTPIDVGDPDERVARIIAGSGAVLGLTTRAAHSGGSGDSSGVTWLMLDDAETLARVADQSSEPVTDADRRGRLTPAHPAYLIHTSGTTGAPKGVAVTHRGLAPLTNHLLARYRATPDSVVLHAHSPAFDAHLLELLAAFAAGARLVIEPPTVVAGPELTALIAEHRVTHLLTTPAVLATLRPADVPSLAVVVVGGEACPPDLVATWAPRVRLHNGYGPTEATVMATQSAPLVAGKPVTIGAPLPEVTALLLDSRLRAVPAGARAELYLGGPCVAQGYIGDPASTAARFVAAPRGGGERVYRTGDLVGPRADGGYEFLGRIDTQLAIRGRRIEPAEIETALLTDPTIAHAAVDIADPGTPTARLIAYVVPTRPSDRPDPQQPFAPSTMPGNTPTLTCGSSDPAASETTSASAPPPANRASEKDVVAAGVTFDAAVSLARLRTVLPVALVPVALVTLDRLPLTANGKLDRAALPAPPSTLYRPPKTALQHLIATTFAAACHLDSVGANDDFFAIGGNSLTGVSVSAQLAQSTNTPITVRWLYTAPTVAALAHRIETYRADADPGADALATVLPLRTGGDHPPLFCVHSAVPLAWCYTGLARHIIDRPVYGLQAPTLSAAQVTSGEYATARTSPPEVLTVDFLARTYATEITRLQPDGPIHLLGWSLGGQLAHATAVRLRAEGRDVATLAMLDSVVVPDQADPPPRPRMRDLLTHLLGDEPDDADTLPDLSAEQAAAELAGAGASLGSGLTAAQLTRLHEAYADGVRLSHGYRPGRFDGDLLYFCATQGMTAFLDAQMWRPFVTGRLVEHPVDTTHAQLTNADVVAHIGPILNRHLRAVETATATP
ncbi:non-ribosomal peptide synthetase [Nocardia fluminea]|uniref:Amino acid adenylation domain-containing protein n=1 Tax=Nocardia fluminea TaxID=134984 RepID=A0A2N3VEM9_9NOCA|nr:non-ribosomal peptide synthetase [Nocardia fluminea]PKV80103.1 amino acid adenylation domain-containing protein [Nocardia fluminea]